MPPPHPGLCLAVVPDAYSTKQLRLFNRGSKPVAFKIKTTNPKQYFVRPNQGIVKAGEKIVIHVMMKKLPQIPKEKCKDRFLLQSAVYDGELPNDKFEWKTHFTDPNHPKPDEIKLNCSYITSGDPEPAPAPATGGSDTGVRQRPVVASKDKAAAAPSPKAPPAAADAKGATKLAVTPPATSSSPPFTMFLIIAVVFFLVGRYTHHVAIPGLD